MGRFSVNVNLVPVKAHYFFLNGGMSPVTPFLPIIGRQLGISSSMVGWIYFALPFAGLISRSGIGFLADRLHMRKRMLFLSLLAMAAAFFAVQYSPSLEDEQQVGFALTCDSNSSGTLNYDRRFSCPCTWEAMNFVENDSNATCALTCPNTDPQPITIKHDGLNFTISKEYNNDCPTGSILKRLSIPFEFIGTSTCVDFDQCHVKCGEDFALKDCLTTGPDSYLQSPGYWSFFTFMIFVWSSMAVSVSLSDTLCFMVLGASAGDYGKQRLFGSIGWGAVVLFAGYLVDLNNPTKNPIKDYSICHKLGFGFLLVDALSVLFIRLPRRESPKNGAEEEEVKEEEEGSHLTRTEARKLEMKSFLVPAVAVFLVIVVLEGMCMALVWNYFFWYLDDLSGAWGVTNPKLLQGLVSFIQCFVGELPFFFLSGYVINRIGHQGALTLVMMAFGVRFLLYSLLENPWVALAIEVSQGLTFSIFYATMASYVHKIYPHEIAATMQGFVGGMNEIGVALGSLIGGYTVEGSSPRYTFRAFGIAALSVGILHLVLRLTVKSIDKFQGFVEKPVDHGDGEDSNNSA